MNIVEAIKSGKSFRRKTWAEDSWIEIRKLYGADEPSVIFRWTADTLSEVRFSPEDLSADDWEVEEDLPLSFTVKTICNVCKEEYATRTPDFGNRHLGGIVSAGGHIARCSCGNTYKITFEIQELES